MCVFYYLKYSLNISHDLNLKKKTVLPKLTTITFPVTAVDSDSTTELQ